MGADVNFGYFMGGKKKARTKTWLCGINTKREKVRVALPPFIFIGGLGLLYYLKMNQGNGKADTFLRKSGRTVKRSIFCGKTNAQLYLN